MKKLKRRFQRKPLFSVVIATYNRNSLIIPTLESVCRQTLKDFEVLVVSDGPYDSELLDTVKQFDDRFSVHALPKRSRSQSGPNNLGWSLARGQYIAYLGHDDIWHPDHLRCLADVFALSDEVDFAVSGCLYLGPPGTENDFSWVTGIFDSNDKTAPLNNFFPPSSFSHRRLLPLSVQKWRDPTMTVRPVDTEFLLNAVNCGSSFASTGRVTVFKFVSAVRYLSYLFPNDDEQRDMVVLLDNEEAFQSFLRQRIEALKLKNHYMALRHMDQKRFIAGDLLRITESARGIALPSMSQVGDGKRLEVGEDYRATDWYGRESDGYKSWRWSGPNCRPRLLLPFSHDAPVVVHLQVAGFASSDIHCSLQVRLNGEIMKTTQEIIDGNFRISFNGLLRHDFPSVVELQMNRTVPESEFKSTIVDRRRLGLCLLGVDVLPLAVHT